MKHIQNLLISVFRLNWNGYRMQTKLMRFRNSKFMLRVSEIYECFSNLDTNGRENRIINVVLGVEGEGDLELES